VTAETLLGLLRHPLPPAEAAEAHTRALRARFQHTFVIIARLRQIYIRRWLLNRAARVAGHNEAFCRDIANLLLGYIDPAQWLSPKMLLRFALG